MNILYIYVEPYFWTAQVPIFALTHLLSFIFSQQYSIHSCSDRETHSHSRAETEVLGAIRDRE